MAEIKLKQGMSFRTKPVVLDDFLQHYKIITILRPVKRNGLPWAECVVSNVAQTPPEEEHDIFIVGSIKGNLVPLTLLQKMVPLPEDS